MTDRMADETQGVGAAASPNAALIAELVSTLNIVRGGLTNLSPYGLSHALIARVDAVLSKAAEAKAA